MILTTIEAKTVYDAMCALNNISALLNTWVEHVNVLENEFGVRVLNYDDATRESYNSQAEFASAYDL